MKISIIGISQLTDFVLDNIINHSDEINIYSDSRNFDFENKNLTKKNVSIFTDKNIDDNLKKICETSDVLFFLSDSDPFNVFSYKKCLVYNPSTKSVFQITDRDIYEMYKDKKYPVISLFDLKEDDYLYLIKE
ncbi:MAG: hypothetical protein FI678_04200 [SAR202 cluster bacterium]|nr:hypothetical protein [SAR202 cluster bacterium]